MATPLLTHCSRVRVSLQLGERTIHWAHSLEPTTQFEYLPKSFVLFIGFFPFTIAFKLFSCCVLVQGMVLHSAPLFSFLALVDKTIHLPVSLITSIIFGFCTISYAEFQSCLLIPFKGIILVKPYITLYAQTIL